jgi:hypothetical protein
VDHRQPPAQEQSGEVSAESVLGSGADWSSAALKAAVSNLAVSWAGGSGDRQSPLIGDW